MDLFINVSLCLAIFMVVFIVSKFRNTHYVGYMHIQLQLYVSFHIEHPLSTPISFVER
jgi:hypothetical protein